MDLIFNDKFNRKIRLTIERIKHIGYHMSLNDKLYLIEETLIRPDILNRDFINQNILYYNKYLKNEQLYLVIAVRVFNGEGFIVTIFKSNRSKT